MLLSLEKEKKTCCFFNFFFTSAQNASHGRVPHLKIKDGPQNIEIGDGLVEVRIKDRP